MAMQADYVTVVEDRPIMSAKYRLPVTFGQNLRSSRTVSLRQLSFLLWLVVVYEFSYLLACLADGKTEVWPCGLWQSINLLWTYGWTSTIEHYFVESFIPQSSHICQQQFSSVNAVCFSRRINTLLSADNVHVSNCCFVITLKSFISPSSPAISVWSSSAFTSSCSQHTLHLWPCVPEELDMGRVNPRVGSGRVTKFSRLDGLGRVNISNIATFSPFSAHNHTAILTEPFPSCSPRQVMKAVVYSTAGSAATLPPSNSHARARLLHYSL